MEWAFEEGVRLLLSIFFSVVNMAVTEQHVRDNLNDMTVAELASGTITLLIQKAEQNYTGSGSSDDYVLAYASYHGFLRSNVWDRVKMGDIKVERTLTALRNDLKDELDKEEMKLFGAVDAVSDAMYDNRPTDPYETGEMDYGDY